jgi:hypothetical protein
MPAASTEVECTIAMLVLAHAMANAPHAMAMKVLARFTCVCPASSCVDLFRRIGRNLKGLAMHEVSAARNVVMCAHNTRCRGKRIYQIPPDLDETMRTAGRYRAAASDLKLEKPE